MKKLILFLIIFSSLAFGGVCADLPTKVIKVGLAYGTNAVAEAAVGCGGGIKAVDMLNDVENFIADLPAGDFTAKLTEQGIELFTKDNPKSVLAYKGTGVLTLQPIKGNMWALGLEYRGGIQLVPDNGKLDVINLIDFEQYLYGVVTKEMYPSWNIEALKAQAVCSRTFMLASGMGRHKGQGFDLCATTHCQAYGGVAKETSKGIQAVEDTRGQVVQYNGKLAEVFYYASDGGVTEDVKNVWGSTGYPYLISIKDPYENATEAKSVWKVELSADDLGKKLTAAGFDVGTPSDLVILETAPSGRVMKIKATGDKGETTLTKEKTRTAFGLKSQLYTVDISGGAPTASILAESGVYSGAIGSVMTDKGIVNNPKTVTVLTANGLSSPIASTAKTYVFNGRGYGHGIGMSQWGAKAMGDKGFKYDEIIKFYFPGTGIGEY